ncbi:hypothetical protein E2P86_11145 [Sphingobacterium psychroaquaticum]|uniref:hypothetical protein n=1 Tax=Sphingobacterium psychroaquaticum TaxID=561061 RepID=UPI00106CABD1|nr:hypothetical protein [Sphingobacterium psychroaquaticum]QBQ41673.1 hypothetical protein E2P86_11145 [Sphingobacterium psychroaquaticum]
MPKVSAQHEITLQSDNKELVEIFDWAKDKARSFVVTGKRGPIDIYKKGQTAALVDYIPSYWAGYPLRTAFYSRDFCHQIIGAHLLGLEEENFTMMRAFASSADSAKKWFPLWAINFDGSPYKLDYRSDNNFVREIPAVFELVEKNLELYQWTGDRRYIDDGFIWTYCTKAVNDFIRLHDTEKRNGVAESTGTGNIFVGTATYNEHRDQTLIEAGDGIGSQYKALEAFSEIALHRGDKNLAKLYKNKSIELKWYFNNQWGVLNNDSLYNRGYNLKGEPVSGWGKENSWFLPLKEITDPVSLRHFKYLEFIDKQLSSDAGLPKNIEAITYIPEIFFKYGQHELGWKWLKYIISKIDYVHEQSELTGNNGDYPEVSFVLIRNIVHDMVGISPSMDLNGIKTCSQLPAEVGQIKVDNVKIGGQLFAVTQMGQRATTMQYKEGTPSVIWRASFVGKHPYLWVDGKKVKSKSSKNFGQVISYVDLTMMKTDTRTVKTSL